MNSFGRKLLSIALLSTTGCNRSATTPPQKSTSPAKVAQVVKEADLATITLTPDAERRLGVRTVPVELRKVTRMRQFGGQVIIPPGRSAVVVAPLTGTLAAPEQNEIPSAGQQIKKDQPVFSLRPLLGPTDRLRFTESLVALSGARLDAEGQVEKAKIQVESAKVVLARAEQLVRDKAGSVKAREEAAAQLAIAESTFNAALARRDLLTRTTLDTEAGAPGAMSILSPSDGLIRKTHALAGQTVAAGSPLFEVERLALVWIRVPVYVGDLARIDTQQNASVSDLAAASTSQPWPASPIVAPPSASSAAITADLFYELENSDGFLRPDQRVAVAVPLHSGEEKLAIPRSAVLHDVHGGTWVFEMVAPQVFIRRRVEVAFVDGPLAMLTQGPQPGAMIVTEAAAELWGTEFGFGK